MRWTGGWSDEEGPGPGTLLACGVWSRPRPLAQFSTHLLWMLRRAVRRNETDTPRSGDLLTSGGDEAGQRPRPGRAAHAPQAGRRALKVDLYVADVGDLHRDGAPEGAHGSGCGSDGPPITWPARAIAAATAAAATPTTVPAMPSGSALAGRLAIPGPDRPHYPFPVPGRKDVGKAQLPQMGYTACPCGLR